jgi:hypothetical protein
MVSSNQTTRKPVFPHGPLGAKDLQAFPRQTYYITSHRFAFCFDLYPSEPNVAFTCQRVEMKLAFGLLLYSVLFRRVLVTATELSASWEYPLEKIGPIDVFDTVNLQWVTNWEEVKLRLLCTTDTTEEPDHQGTYFSL